MRRAGDAVGAPLSWPQAIEAGLKKFADAAKGDAAALAKLYADGGARRDVLGREEIERSSRGW